MPALYGPHPISSLNYKQRVSVFLKPEETRARAVSCIIGAGGVIVVDALAQADATDWPPFHDSRSPDISLAWGDTMLSCYLNP